MENVNFIFTFMPSDGIKNLLEIVVKLKIKKCWRYCIYRVGLHYNYD